MRKILIGFGSFIGLLVVILLVAPLFISADLVKSQVTERVSNASGKTLEIGGDVSVSLITGLKLKAQDVRLSEPDGTPLVSIGSVDFGLALTPLLSGIVEITGITLDDPRITLASGAKTGDQSEGGDTAGSEADANSDPLGGLSPDTFRLKRFSIRNGLLVKRNADGSDETLINQFDLDLSLPSLDQPAEATGSFTFRDKRHDLGLTVGNPYAALRKQGTEVAVTLSSDLSRLDVNGTIMKGETTFNGVIKAGVTSLSNLAGWLSGSSQSLPVTTVGFDGQILIEDNEIKIPQLNGKLDDTPVTAAARISTGGDKPILRLAIDLQSLDLDPFLSGNSSPPSESNSSGSSAGSPSGGNPIDLSPLEAFNGFVDVRIARLKAKGATVEDVVFITKVQDGSLNATLRQARLAGGTASLELTALPVNGVPILSASANLASLDAGALMAIAGQSQLPVKGKLSAETNLQTTGLTPDELRKNLDITAGVRMHNASVRGVGKILGNPKADVISDLDITASVTSLTSPVTLKGAMTWNGERVSLDANADPRPLVDGEATSLKASIKSRPIWVRYNGRIDPTGPTPADGEVTISADSLKRLLGWVGQQTHEGTPDGDLSLKTQLAVASQALRFEQTSLTFGETKGKGKGRVGFAGKPDIQATFVFDVLDVTPFLGSGEASSEHRQATKTKAKKGWSQDPIDLSGLKAANVAFDLTTRQLRANNIKVGQSRVTLDLKDGLATVDLKELALYQGSGTGRVQVDGRTDHPAITSRFDLSGLNARPFLKDAAGFDSIEGTGNISLNLATSGQSEQQLVSALNGKAAFRFENGAIVGLNVPRMMRALTTDILTGWAKTQSEKTDFSELSASFDFVNGVATNKDLTMLGPLVRVSGAGTASLPPRTIDYRVEPKIVANLTGQGGRVGVEGLPVPVIIKGSWDNPKIYPDIKGILTDPKNAFNQLKSLSGSLGSELLDSVDKAGDVGKVVTDVLGGNSKDIGDGLQKILGGGNKSENTQDQANPDQNQQEQPQKSLEDEAIKSLGNILFGN